MCYRFIASLKSRMTSKFSVISAFTKRQRGIGFKNRLPWSIKEDMNWFKKITTSKYENTDGNTVIMGRKTWDSIPKKYKPLPGRQNVVLSRNVSCAPIISYASDATIWTDNIDSALRKKSKNFIIGGAGVYEQSILHDDCEELYLTEIDETVYNGGERIECDTFFPKIPKHFRKVEEIPGKTPGVTFQIWKNWRYFESPEYQYIEMLREIIDHGEETIGRNGKVLSIFGDFQHKFDLRDGFPMLTTKRMPFDIIMKELLFFMNGQTDAKLLASDGVHIWDGNTSRDFLDNRGLQHYAEGDMGPMYGWNWRNFGAKYTGCNTNYKSQGYDQLRQLINNIVTDPNSRRLLLTTYDPSKVRESVLAPCHGLTIQFNVSNGKYLDCKMFQRSIDVALGYSFNIASYAAFTHIIAAATGLAPRYLFMTLGDTHIYEQHIPKVKRHFVRHPLKFPKFEITKHPIGDRIEWIESLNSEDFKLSEYHYYPGIKMDMVA